MTLFVNRLVKGTSELLHGVDENLVALAIHLEAFGERLALTFNHTLSCQDHVIEDLMMEHIDFTCRLIVLL